MPLKRVASILIGLSLAVGVFAAADKSSKKTDSSKKEAPASPVDINRASKEELTKVPGIGSATADKIIAKRPYSSVSDLSKAGLSAKQVTELTPHLTVGAAAPPANVPSSPAKSSPAKSTPAPAATKTAAPETPKKSAAVSAPATGSPGPGMVWVNLETKVYHKMGSKWYGNTKHGKYMSEADAQSAGYRAAKDE